MKSYSMLKKELDKFGLSVSNLSGVIKNCGVDWKDEQYKNISSIVTVVANNSKKINQSGKMCSDAIEQFNKILSEH